MRRLSQRWTYFSNWSPPARNGVFLVVAAVALTAVLAFVAFSVDLGVVSLTKTRMQNATDAAALAAAMEITNALQTADTNVTDVFAYALEQARTTGANVAQMNGIYVNPNTDVIFGKRTYNPANETFSTSWNVGETQVNVVKVIARRTENDTTLPDGKVPGIFSSALGHTGTPLTAESVAYIEPRDIVVVHDFSRSMNFDSYYNDEQSVMLPQATIEANMQMVWDDLGLTLGTMTYLPQYISKTQSNTGANGTVTFKGKTVDVTTNTKIKSVKLTFTDNYTQTFNISNETTTSGTWQGTGGNANKRIKQVDLTIRKVGSSSQSWTLSPHYYNTSTIQQALGLSSVSYPYSGGSWSEYFSFVQSNQGLINFGKQDMYGGQTFVCYLLRSRPKYSDTKDLWKTRHYPFHAIKEGHELLCNYLTELGFDDQLGMVSYDSNHRQETSISDTNPDTPDVDISSDPITNDFDSVNKLMKYKQAAHYSFATNMAGGMKDAIALLDAHKRGGSRPAILLMTDGNGNTLDSGESTSLPSGWDWNSLFDYNGDGVADYSTTNDSAKVTLKYVKEAVDKGYVIHCISVGVDADKNLLEAIAWLGNGYHINVPGGTSVADMEATMKEAFAKIAAAVPPARLTPPSE